MLTFRELQSTIRPKILISLEFWCFRMYYIRLSDSFSTPWNLLYISRNPILKRFPKIRTYIIIKQFYPHQTYQYSLLKIRKQTSNTNILTTSFMEIGKLKEKFERKITYHCTIFKLNMTRNLEDYVTRPVSKLSRHRLWRKIPVFETWLKYF